MLNIHIPHARLETIFDCKQTASPDMCEHIPHMSRQTGVISDEQLDVYKMG